MNNKQLDMVLDYLNEGLFKDMKTIRKKMKDQQNKSNENKKKYAYEFLSMVKQCEDKDAYYIIKNTGQGTFCDTMLAFYLLKTPESDFNKAIDKIIKEKYKGNVPYDDDDIEESLRNQDFKKEIEFIKKHHYITISDEGSDAMLLYFPDIRKFVKYTDWFLYIDQQMSYNACVNDFGRHLFTYYDKNALKEADEKLGLGLIK